MKPTLPIVVLISGRGSNLQSIIDAIAGDELPAERRQQRLGAEGLVASDEETLLEATLEPGGDEVAGVGQLDGDPAWATVAP